MRLGATCGRRALAAAALFCLPALAGAAEMTEVGRIDVPAGIAVRFLMVSPDGRQLTAACDDRKLRVWALPSAPVSMPLRTREVGGGPISNIAYSRNGAWMAAGTAKGTVAVFRAGSGEAVNRFPTTEAGRSEEVQALALSSDGSRVALARSGVPPELWDVGTGKRRAPAVVRQLPKQKHPIQWLAALAKGATVVTGSFQEKSARLPGPTLTWPLDGSAPSVVVADRQFNGGGPVADGSLVLTSMEGGAIVVWAVREPITLKEPARP